jgi:inner membrane protein
MDSLTQITLGAAVGEVVLGKKAGNKAMLWGAIGGTLPDLDVFANLAADEISALAFHRAITHSFFFAALAPLVLGWLVHRLYRDGPGIQWWRDWLLAWLSLILLVWLGAAVMPIPFQVGLSIAGVVGLSLVFLPAVAAGSRLLRRKGTWPGASQHDWTLLFFWSIFTHPLLDACTTYGTQLLQPFSSYRVGWNNISVVDPLYTLPFLICLLIASFFSRESRTRRIFNWAGLILSCTYLLFTFYNKYRVNEIFTQSLKKQEIRYERFRTSPTIFNNILWQGVAESDTVFYEGEYSLLDTRPEIDSFRTVAKNRHLVNGHENDRDLAILRWFSDDYFALRERDGRLYYYDLRFGSLPGNQEERSFVFQFLLEMENGEIRARQSREPPQTDGAFRALWERLKGR